MALEQLQRDTKVTLERSKGQFGEADKELANMLAKQGFMLLVKSLQLLFRLVVL